MPELEHPHVLLATLGGQPQIVTFTLDLLLSRNIPVSEVIVIHTASHPRLAQAFARLSAEFTGTHYRFNGEMRPMHFHRQLLRHYGRPIDDITDDESANGTLTAMDELVTDLKQRHYTLHFSISGGRRLMSFLSFSTALLNFTSADHLWHIYTPDAITQRVKASGEMHVAPEGGVRLIEVPFARMAQPLLPRVLDMVHGKARIEQENMRYNAVQHERCQQVVDQLKPGRLRVLRAFALGMSPKEVADSLHISVTTISTHTGAIYGLIRNAWGFDDKPMTYKDLQILFEAYFHNTSNSNE